MDDTAPLTARDPAGRSAGSWTRPASARIDEATQTKIAGMLVSLLQSPKHRAQARGRYAAWLTRLEPGLAVERRARAAFFAAEGAVFDDILALL